MFPSAGWKNNQVVVTQVYLQKQLIIGRYPFRMPLSFPMVPYHQMPQRDRLKLWTGFCFDVMTGALLNGLTTIIPLLFWSLDDKRALLAKTQIALGLPPADEVLPPHFRPSRDIPTHRLPPYLISPHHRPPQDQGPEPKKKAKPGKPKLEERPGKEQEQKPTLEVEPEPEPYPIPQRGGSPISIPITVEPSSPVEEAALAEEGEAKNASGGGGISGNAPDVETDKVRPKHSRVTSGTLPPPLSTIAARKLKDDEKSQEKN